MPSALAILALLFYGLPSILVAFLIRKLKQKEHGKPNDETLSEVDGGPLPNHTSLFLHIEQGLRKNPHEPAVICMHQSPNSLSGLIPSDGQFTQKQSGPRHECLVLTYNELHRTSLKLAAGLAAHGVRPNTTTLMLIPNSGEYCLLLWTCIIMRLTFVCLDPSTLAASDPAELRDVMESVKPSIVIVPDAAGAKSMDTLLASLDNDHALRISLTTRSEDGSWKSLTDLAANATGHPPDEEKLLDAARNDDEDRINSIMFTSGTSGRSKGCPLRVGGMTHVLHSQSWLINKDNCAFALQQAHNSRGIAPAQTLQTWRAGGAVVMTGRGFAADDMVDAIRKHGVTFVVLTPAMVHALAPLLSAHTLEAMSVRTVQVGGDAVTKDILMKCAALFPKAEVCVNHGMTEGGACFTWPFFETPAAEIPYFGEICPVGAVARGVVVRVWDAEGKCVARRGRPGELHLHCSSIIRHYLDGVSESSFYEDDRGRWFNTGDVALMDDSGLVFILGRKKDMIKSNGIAIMPAALESSIEQFTGAQVSHTLSFRLVILQACSLLLTGDSAFKTSVIAVSHPLLGQVPFAVLSSLNGKTQKEIKSYILRTLGKGYALGGLATLEEVGLSEFTVNATHKIVRSEVEKAVQRSYVKA
ncbi:4-coumarate--CoA ligase 2 [Lasiodiplodia hormozganensis]|uniref:4-coumarate--CoA ligase 2 n=1 Tax=Lasiodiplodia hormozganensis TaxID=869390 RepID=A0AA39Y4E1_9PEZI|nr:4-coumarate--CoA ligase 2 [Lasiodiplodia hormozganensis]